MLDRFNVTRVADGDAVLYTPVYDFQEVPTVMDTDLDAKSIFFHSEDGLDHKSPDPESAVLPKYAIFAVNPDGSKSDNNALFDAEKAEFKAYPINHVGDKLVPDFDKPMSIDDLHDVYPKEDYEFGRLKDTAKAVNELATMDDPVPYASTDLNTGAQEQIEKAELDRFNPRHLIVYEQSDIEDLLKDQVQYAQDPYDGVKVRDILANDVDFAQAVKNVPGSSLDGAMFDNVDLTHSTLKGVKARHATFNDSILNGVDMSDSLLDNSFFNSVEMSDIDLSRSDMEHVLIDNADLIRASFMDTNLSRSEIIRSDMQDMTISNANLKDVQFIDSNMTNATLDRGFAKNVLFEDVNAKDLHVYVNDSIDFKELKSKGSTDFSKADKEVVNQFFGKGFNLEGLDDDGLVK